ncbi:hypothetical protein D3C80_1785660 [compost metagenome]
MANLRRHLFQIVPLRGSDQSLQRQIVKFHRAQHIGVDQLRNSRGAAGSGLLSVGVFANQQERDNAQNCDNRQGAAEDHHDLRSTGIA